MLILGILVIITGAATGKERDIATDFMGYYKNITNDPIGMLTTTTGAAVTYEEATNTLNMPLIRNNHFMETMTHFVRERPIERVVHAKGTGAFGYFEVTHDITNFCKAKLFSKIGKKTPVVVRFSGSLFEKGSSDFHYDTRGYACKFYTEDGNFDMVGFNTPAFSINDPIEFPLSVRASKRNPTTGLQDLNALCDLITQLPHILYLQVLTLSGRGIPASYIHMPGFSIHTYEFVNECGDRTYGRFHFEPNAGIKNFGLKDIMTYGSDYDYLTRDLYKRIGNGEYPSWTVSIQFINESYAKKDPRVFDLTRIINKDKFPLHPVGQLYLDRNPKNVFADIEHAAFCPGHLVPGINGAPDKTFEARRISYRDAQMQRLGINFNKIPVNCPFRTKAFTYNRDGVSPVNDNGRDAPFYYPNTFNGPVPCIDEKKSSGLLEIVEYKANTVDQTRELYANELTADERTLLVANFVAIIKPAVKRLQEKMIETLTHIHPNLGERIKQSLNETMYT